MTLLYPKLAKAGVTANVIWDLDDEMLDQAKLSKIEKLQYNKAKEKFCRLTSLGKRKTEI